MQMRSKILNLPSSSSTAVHRSVLKDAKKNDGNGSEKITRPNTRLVSGANKAIIGGRDGNSRNYAAMSTRWSGQD